MSDDRKKTVIDLYFNQHKTYAEIAQIERISPCDIHAIIKEEEAGRQKHKHQQHRQEITSKAYQLFSEGKTYVQVAIILNLRGPQVTKYNREYWKLKGLNKLNTIHIEINGIAWPLWKLYQQLVKKKGMSIEQVVFFFWRYQQYHMASHRYDYEPIFVYLKDKDTKPHLIVNGGLGGASCSFHKNEVRPRTGK